MILDTEDSISLTQMMSEKRAFAFYRLPKENTIHFIAQNTTELLIANDPHELNDKRGFVIAPFKTSTETPICLIYPDIEKQFYMGDYNNTDGSDNFIVTSCDDTYRTHFDIFKKELLNSRFDKLVLSRCQIEEMPEHFDAVDCFNRACSYYPNAYVYMCYTPYTGLWMGCSPEILLSARQDKWRTVALAGTQSMPSSQDYLKWDDKNLEEQAYVSTYIRTQLNTLGILAAEKGPYTQKAGRLAHLRTDFEFLLSSRQGLGKLLKLLHPTPAVCGLPKMDAYRFITENEGYDRKYYSGFVGLIDPGKETDLYVNLRCISIDKNELTFYAGGGLLSASSLEDEWMETEKKMCTMKNIINSQ